MIIKKKIYKVKSHYNSMKKEGCFVFCNNPISLKLSNSDISRINLTGVTQLKTSCGLSGNRTHTSYFGDKRATTTLLAH